ncbi:hypothetical protein, partial [Segatella copri]|uniref:hypothetical protein n=1 Tax=Segatella copri TaxID=165179 RepID=UPI001C393888
VLPYVIHPKTAVLGRAGGGNICFFRYDFLVLGVSFVGNATPCLYFLTFSGSIQEVIINKD